MSVIIRVSESYRALKSVGTDMSVIIRARECYRAVKTVALPVLSV